MTDTLPMSSGSIQNRHVERMQEEVSSVATVIARYYKELLSQGIPSELAALLVERLNMELCARFNQ